MIPILYSSGETTFETNGLGRLTDTISCEVTEERNGIYEVELVYPVTGIHYSEIQIGRIIFCTHDTTKDPQPFDIYKRSAEIDGRVTFYAHHISYRLNTIVSVAGIRFADIPASEALTYLKEAAVGGCPFAFYTDKTTIGDLDLETPKTIRQHMAGEEGSILDNFDGGEYFFDKFAVWLYASRGRENIATIRYGGNLTELTADASTEGRYTAAVPYWVNPESGWVATLPEYAVMAGTMPTMEDYWTTEDDEIIRTEGGEPFEFVYPVVEYIPMDLSDMWETEPTAEQLRTAARARLQASRAWESDENLTISYTTDDTETNGLLDEIRLCDTITVVYPAAGISVEAKVIQTVYDALRERYVSIEVGKPKSTLVDAITEKTEELIQPYAKRTYMAAAIESATKLITGATGGHVVFNMDADGKPEEILIMDTDDTATARNVLRMNLAGIGFSTSGYEGPFSTAWTIDGHFVASYINSGTIRGLNGQSYWNLDTGVLGVVQGARETRLTGGALRMLYNDTPMAALEPSTWAGTYVGSGNKGMTLRALEGADYLSIGYTDTNGTLMAAIVIDRTLHPGIAARAEVIRLMSNLYSNSYIAAAGNIWSESNIVAAKDISYGGTWWKNVISIGYDAEAGGRLRATYPTASGADTYYTKTLVACSPTGAVTYAAGTVLGDLAVQGHLMVTNNLAVDGGLDVTGGADITGLLTAHNGLSVTGAASVSGLLSANGGIAAVNYTVSGALYSPDQDGTGITIEMCGMPPEITSGIPTGKAVATPDVNGRRVAGLYCDGNYLYILGEFDGTQQAPSYRRVVVLVPPT